MVKMLKHMVNDWLNGEIYGLMPIVNQVIIMMIGSWYKIGIIIV